MIAIPITIAMRPGVGITITTRIFRQAWPSAIGFLPAWSVS